MKRGFSLKLTLLLTAMMTMMAGAVVAPSLPQINAHFRDLPHAALLTRLVITLPALFIALFSPLVGRLIDLTGRRKWLLASLVLYCLAGTSGAFLDNLYLILAGRAVLGIAVAGIMTICVTLVGDYFQGEERSAFLGMQGAFVAMGAIVFISLAGLFADIHWQMPFYIYTFSLPVLLAAVRFLPEPDRRSIAAQAPGLEIGAALDYPKGQVFLVYGIVFIGIVFFYMIPVQVPFLVSALDGASNAMAGYAISASTLSSSIVSMNYRRIKSKRSFPLIIGMAFLLMGAGYLALSVSPDYPRYILSLILSGTGLGLFMPTGNLWLISLAPAPLRGRIIGRGSAAMFTGMFLSPILLQPVIVASTSAHAFGFAGAVLICLAVVFLSVRNRL